MAGIYWVGICFLFNGGEADMKNIEPTFKAIFGDAWQHMPAVMHKHYANRPYSAESYRVEGKLTVFAHPILRCFAPILRLLGGVPAYNAEDVSVTVDFNSDPKSNAFHFYRIFEFRGQRPYIFHSKMVPVKNNELVEVMKFRLGWRVAFNWVDGKVILNHRGYCLCVFGKFIPLPINWLIGIAYAEEEPINETMFKMSVEIKHPLFGSVYGYHGEFAVAETDD